MNKRTIQEILDAKAEEARQRMEADLLRESLPNQVVLSERDKQIVQLTRKGLSARKVKERLGLDITKDRVAVIARAHVGATAKGGMSSTNFISPSFMPYVKEALRRLGKDPTTCEMCEEKPEKGCIVHHTKYKGCTVYDLMYICQSCNLSRVNKGLK